MAQDLEAFPVLVRDDSHFGITIDPIRRVDDRAVDTARQRSLGKRVRLAAVAAQGRIGERRGEVALGAITIALRQACQTTFQKRQRRVGMVGSGTSMGKLPDVAKSRPDSVVGVVMRKSAVFGKSEPFSWINPTRYVSLREQGVTP